MNQERMFQVIVAPIVSEKSTQISTANYYAFRVLKSATKREIKKAVEAFFKVNVVAVRTSIVKEKKKIFKGRVGYRRGWKKAMVKVAEGQMIDIGTGS